MRRSGIASWIIQAVVAVVLAASLASAAEHPTSFKSVNVGLPFGDQMFPDGPGSDVTANNCLACHSAGMVLTQPPLPRATWQAEVDKMRAVYKAPVSDEDMKPIVDYLTRIKGPR